MKKTVHFPEEKRKRQEERGSSFLEEDCPLQGKGFPRSGEERKGEGEVVEDHGGVPRRSRGLTETTFQGTPPLPVVVESINHDPVGGPVRKVDRHEVHHQVVGPFDAGNGPTRFTRFSGKSLAKSMFWVLREVIQRAAWRMGRWYRRRSRSAPRRVHLHQDQHD